jgi:tetratricopeptide (TPR) repeat protein
VTLGEHDAPPQIDDFGLWLAACDDRLAAGASVGPLDEVGVPDALRPRLEMEAAWCQLVRRVWPGATDRELPPTEPRLRNEASSSEQPPSEVGRFLVRQELGRGSFGIVYLAHDPRLRREVALKVPRGEVLMSSELRARFRNEAMAAAGLDHPNIVPVYEAGEAGPICFIASAYCPGITLAAWLRLRDRPVPPRSAAGLVATLAEAVAHAHRRGVLHRDLKPSNVLLERQSAAAGDWHGDEPGRDLVPRVTDFGLAKLLADGPAADATLNPTQHGVLVGTPSYMAPEQAEGRPGAVGPAADVYSLGVILYEVLTGRPPFQGDSVLDTLVLVRTQDPLPPSKLSPRVPRDLETICLKCLHKLPAARYGTAEELAADLRRYLAAEPIRARPTPALERAVKWVRRHPAVTTLAGAASFTALALAVVIVTATVRLKHERDLAEKRRLEAVANLQKAREAVDRMLTRVSQERLRGIPQVEPVQRALLEDALEFYRGFARDAHDDPEILVEASRAYRRLGSTYESFGRQKEAETCLREALSLQEKLAAAFPTIATYRSEQVLTRNALGRLWQSLDRNTEAAETLRKANLLLDDLTIGEPANDEYRVQRAVVATTHGIVLDNLRQSKAAEAEYLTAIELVDELAARFPNVIEYRTKAALPRNNLAVLMEDLGRLDEAETLQRRNLALWEELAAGDAANPDYRSKVALTVDNLAPLLEKSGREAEAERCLRRVVELRKSLTEDFPSTPHHFCKLAEALHHRARMAGNRREFAEARRLQEQAITARRAALALAPGNTNYRRWLADACANLVETLITERKHEEATTAAAEIASISEDSAGDSLRAASFVARCVPLAAGDLQLAESRRAERAEGYAERAIALLREAVKKGHRDAEAVRNDRGFDSLRARPDFGALLAALAPSPVAARP